MASYLLKAPDEDMARWKEDAKERGMSFAAYVRSRLDSANQHTAGPMETFIKDNVKNPVSEPALHFPEKVTKTEIPSAKIRLSDGTEIGKKTYKPDPK